MNRQFRSAILSLSVVALTSGLANSAHAQTSEVSPPQPQISEPPALLSPDTLPKVNRQNELIYTSHGPRLPNGSSWKLNGYGEGEINIPFAIGLYIPDRSGTNRQFNFKAGTHQFTIGSSAASEIFALFEPITSKRITSRDVTGAPFNCKEFGKDLPTEKLNWTMADVPGQFILHNGCGGAQRRATQEMFVEVWRMLARPMLARDNPEVSEEIDLTQPAPIPMKLTLKKNNVWTQLETRWEINPDGQGWISVSAPTSIILKGRTATHYLTKGVHRFNVTPTGYQMVRAELEPFMSGPERTSHCDGMSDQPLIQLAWEGTGAPSGLYYGDMGCLALAARLERVEHLIANTLAPNARQGRRLAP